MAADMERRMEKGTDAFASLLSVSPAAKRGDGTNGEMPRKCGEGSGEGGGGRTTSVARSESQGKRCAGSCEREKPVRPLRSSRTVVSSPHFCRYGYGVCPSFDQEKTSAVS